MKACCTKQGGESWLLLRLTNGIKASWPISLPAGAQIDSHIDAILVKIAAAGLTPGKHLGATLASLPQQLAKLRR